MNWEALITTLKLAAATSVILMIIALLPISDCSKVLASDNACVGVRLALGFRWQRLYLHPEARAAPFFVAGIARARYLKFLRESLSVNSSIRRQASAAGAAPVRPWA